MAPDRRTHWAIMFGLGVAFLAMFVIVNLTRGDGVLTATQGFALPLAILVVGLLTPDPAERITRMLHLGDRRRRSLRRVQPLLWHMLLLLFVAVSMGPEIAREGVNSVMDVIGIVAAASALYVLGTELRQLRRTSGATQPTGDAEKDPDAARA